VSASKGKWHHGGLSRCPGTWVDPSGHCSSIWTSSDRWEPAKQRHVVRRDGTISPLSHASSRQKYRTPLKDGRVSFYVQNPDDGYRTPEVRGSVV
jgi:hypothetical protein